MRGKEGKHNGSHLVFPPTGFEDGNALTDCVTMLHKVGRDNHLFRMSRLAIPGLPSSLLMTAVFESNLFNPLNPLNPSPLFVFFVFVSLQLWCMSCERLPGFWLHKISAKRIFEARGYSTSSRVQT